MGIYFTSGYWAAYFEDLSLNGNPDALLFLTHNWTAGGNTYNNQFSPVSYDFTHTRWFIRSYIPQDEFTDVPDGATWNVHIVPTADDHTFRHTTTSAYTSNNFTTLDHPALNGNPHALLLITNQWPTSFIGVTFSSMLPSYDESSNR